MNRVRKSLWLLYLLLVACGGGTARTSAPTTANITLALTPLGGRETWANATSVVALEHDGSEFALWPIGTDWPAFSVLHSAPSPTCISVGQRGDIVECATPFTDCVHTLKLDRTNETSMQITQLGAAGSECEEITDHIGAFQKVPASELAVRAFMAVLPSQLDYWQRAAGPRAAAFLAHLGERFKMRMARENVPNLPRASTAFVQALVFARIGCEGRVPNLFMPCMDHAFDDSLEQAASENTVTSEGSSIVRQSVPSLPGIDGLWAGTLSPDAERSWRERGFRLHASSHDATLSLRFIGTRTLDGTTCTGSLHDSEWTTFACEHHPYDDIHNHVREERADFERAENSEPTIAHDRSIGTRVLHVAGRDVLVVRLLHGDWTEVNGEGGVHVSCRQNERNCGRGPRVWDEGVLAFVRVDPLALAASRFLDEVQEEQETSMIARATIGLPERDVVLDFLRRELPAHHIQVDGDEGSALADGYYAATAMVMMQACVMESGNMPAAAVADVRATVTAMRASEHTPAETEQLRLHLNELVRPCADHILATPHLFDGLTQMLGGGRAL